MACGSFVYFVFAVSLLSSIWSLCPASFAFDVSFAPFVTDVICCAFVVPFGVVCAMCVSCLLCDMCGL